MIKRLILACAAMLSLSVCLFGEVRTSVKAEFYNTLLSLTGLENEWGHTLTGMAGVSFKNKSREIRGELALDFTEYESQLVPTLKKLYIRPSFGPLRVSIGKTRSTWGAGFAFNGGDIIFGSDSLDFNTLAADPRSETAWLINCEIPLGDFSFMEIITLAGTAAPAGTIPKLNRSSAGGRFSFEIGPVNWQTGYLYRGSPLSGLGERGHRVFTTLEGIAPLDWHVSASTGWELNRLETAKLKESLLITGGISRDHFLGEWEDVSFSWMVEYLVKPYNSWQDDSSGQYGIYLFPSLNLVPPGTVVYTINSLISPIDLSANSTAGVNWNIYEELTLMGYFSIQTGEAGDLFHPGKTGGLSGTLGAQYSY